MVTLNRAELTKSIGAAVDAEAAKIEKRIAAINAELAQIQAVRETAPRPGGAFVLKDIGFDPERPQVACHVSPTTKPDTSAEVARLLGEAAKSTDPGIVSAYRARAREVAGL